MLGTAVIESLQAQGHEIARLVRPATQKRLQDVARPGEQRNVLWDPVAGLLESRAEESNVVINLAGASIGEGRWTAARKRLLEESRVAATRHLVGALGKLRQPPQVFVAASAVGYYGDRGDEELTEESAPGNDFLARLCRNWEAESLLAKEFGARVVLLRCGIVLARQGGALPRMAMPFRLGVGGRIGSGKQWMSWIALEDVVGVVRYAIETNLLSGPANVVASHPVRNAEFTTALGHVLHRPALFPAPAFAMRLALGEMADGLLLSSQRALPKKLEQLGYSFLFTDLEAALATVLHKSR